MRSGLNKGLFEKIGAQGTANKNAVIVTKVTIGQLLSSLFWEGNGSYFYGMNDHAQINIAYAEDHPITRTGVVNYLQPFDRLHIGIVAENGRELLNEIEAAEQLPDVCILDIEMPVMNGFEVQQQLKARWPSIRSLVFTAHPQEGYICRMIRYGANGYLPKDISQEELKEAIIHIYDHGYYYSSVAGNQLFYQVLSNTVDFPEFTTMETNLLKQICTEQTYYEIAEKLGTSVASVKGCRNRLFDKLNVRSRVGLVMYAIKSGLVPLSSMDNN